MNPHEGLESKLNADGTSLGETFSSSHGDLEQLAQPIKLGEARERIEQKIAEADEQLPPDVRARLSGLGL